MRRRIVLLAGVGESTRIIYHALTAEFDVVKVILEKPVPRNEFLRRRARRHGWAKVLGQVLFMALVVPLLRLEARSRVAEIKRQHGLRDDPIDPARVIRVQSANAADCTAALRELAPDVVVVSGTRILSKELLLAISVPFLNIHAGMTPMYRGVHGGYWALASGDPEHCGVTVHQVDAGIDTGLIVARERIVYTPHDNFVSYPLLQLAAGIPRLVEALREPIVKPAIDRAGTQPSRLWSHPTISQYLSQRLRAGVR